MDRRCGGRSFTRHVPRTPQMEQCLAIAAARQLQSNMGTEIHYHRTQLTIRVS